MEQPSCPDRIFGHMGQRASFKPLGKESACRVFHICESGHDVELTDPFASGTAIEKPVQKLGPVPGAPERVKNVYDVSQALSWIATNRTNTEERLIWQSQIPEIVDELIVTL